MTEIIETKSGKISHIWWLTLLIGIIYIIIGVIMVSNPIHSFYTICKIAGIPLVISGIYETYLTISNYKKLDLKGWLVFSGLIDIAIGLILILKPQIILIPVTLLISALLIYQSVLLIRKAFKQKATHPEGWKWILGLGVILIIISIMLIVKPEIVGAALAIWLGIIFAVFGVYRIYLFFKAK